MRIILSIIIFSMLASGCMSVKYQGTPPKITTTASHQIIHSEILTNTNHMFMRLSDEDDIVYRQNYGGGGSTVGLLFGAFGLASNIFGIQNNTEKDVKLLHNKINVKPVDLFKKSSRLHDVDFASGNSAPVKICPFIFVTKTEEEKLLFASGLVVETAVSSSSKWVGKYKYQTVIKMSKDDVADGLNEEEYIRLSLALQQGFDDLLELYLADRDGKLLPERALSFKSDFVSPRFNLEMVGEAMPSKEGRVNIRTAGVVYSLPEESVTLKYKN
ncbi:MAG: hypothetical protein ACI9Y1_003449 [Lentisphaeria bacterium]|jgi:hypothetical protein